MNTRWTVFLVVVTCLLALPAQAQSWTGSGTAGDPYLIYDANDMQAIGADPNFWDAHFKLMADIDLGGFTGTSFNIIGNSTTPFTGVFDGNDHRIWNFTYYSPSENDVGLFGLVDDLNAIIAGVQLTEPNVDAGWGNNVGALVANLNSGTVVNCRVQGGAVSGDHSVGGLVGRASNAEVANCSTATTVSGKGFFTGGLIATIAQGRVSDNYSVSEVAGSTYVGGLVGLFSSGGLIHNCYSTGRVSGTDYLGGLIGEHWDDGSYNKCFWDSDINPDVNGIGDKNDPNVIGKSTTQMQTKSTFTDAGWDFVGESINGHNDIWDICEGTNYPKLVWQMPVGDFVCPDGVNMRDFSFFAGHWLADDCNAGNDYCQSTDLDLSGAVEANDLFIFTQNWLNSV